MGQDSEVRADAIDYLWGAVLHQGTPWTVTPVAALVVAGLLDDPVLDDATPATAFGGPVRSSRSHLIDFLSGALVAGRPDLADQELEEQLRAAVADRAADADDSEARWAAMYMSAVRGCREIAPDLVVPLLEQLEGADPSARASAANALVKAVALPNLSHRSSEVAGSVARMVSGAGVGSDERCALILALGELGEDTSAFLDDESQAVRCCAALAPSQAASPAAFHEILAALQRPGAIEDWFGERSPQFNMRPRFSLVAAAISRADSFEGIAPAARAVAVVASKYTVNYDWGPLLVAAFPGGYNGAPLTHSQASFLGALVANDDLWHSIYGNTIRWFQEARLPRDRAECAKIAGLQ